MNTFGLGIKNLEGLSADFGCFILLRGKIMNKVRCVDASCSFGELTKDKEYTVVARSTGWVKVFANNSVERYFYASRFTTSLSDTVELGRPPTPRVVIITPPRERRAIKK